MKIQIKSLIVTRVVIGTFFRSIYSMASLNCTLSIKDIFLDFEMFYKHPLILDNILLLFCYSWYDNNISVDLFCVQEKKGENSPALKIAWSHQLKDSEKIRNNKKKLITILTNDKNNRNNLRTNRKTKNVNSSEQKAQKKTFILILRGTK